MTCRVCQHPDKFEIEKAFIEGTSLRDIARQHGVSKDSVQFHGKEHIVKMLLKAYEIQDASQGSQLYRQVIGLGETAQRLLEKAEARDDLKTALDGVGKLRGVLELIAKMSGELKEQTQVTNILVASPEWGQLRARLMQALTPYPEARTAVIEAISSGHAVNGDTPAIDLS